MENSILVRGNSLYKGPVTGHIKKLKVGQCGQSSENKDRREVCESQEQKSNNASFQKAKVKFVYKERLVLYFSPAKQGVSKQWSNDFRVLNSNRLNLN